MIIASRSECCRRPRSRCNTPWLKSFPLSCQRFLLAPPFPRFRGRPGHSMDGCVDQCLAHPGSGVDAEGGAPRAGAAAVARALVPKGRSRLRADTADQGDFEDTSSRGLVCSVQAPDGRRTSLARTRRIPRVFSSSTSLRLRYRIMHRGPRTGPLSRSYLGTSLPCCRPPLPAPLILVFPPHLAGRRCVAASSGRRWCSVTPYWARNRVALHHCATWLHGSGLLAGLVDCRCLMEWHVRGR
jgi:hypothetical protein